MHSLILSKIHSSNSIFKFIYCFHFLSSNEEMIQDLLLSIVFKAPSLLHMTLFEQSHWLSEALGFPYARWNPCSGHCDTNAKLTIQKPVFTTTDYYSDSLFKAQIIFKPQHVLESWAHILFRDCSAATAITKILAKTGFAKFMWYPWHGKKCFKFSFIVYSESLYF